MLVRWDEADAKVLAGATTSTSPVPAGHGRRLGRWTHRPLTLRVRHGRATRPAGDSDPSSSSPTTRSSVPQRLITRARSLGAAWLDHGYSALVGGRGVTRRACMMGLHQWFCIRRISVLMKLSAV